jgi:hypothetical protein
MRVAVLSVVLICAIVIAGVAFLLETRGGEANRFGFTIPNNITTLDGAIDYVRQSEGKHGSRELYDGPDAAITTGISGFGEMVPPKILATVRGNSADEAQRRKVEWGDEFRKLFDRWELCDIDIEWNLVVVDGHGGSGELISPHHDDPNLDDAFISPGCDKPAVKERYPYGH